MVNSDTEMVKTDLENLSDPDSTSSGLLGSSFTESSSIPPRNIYYRRIRFTDLLCTRGQRLPPKDQSPVLMIHNDLSSPPVSSGLFLQSTSETSVVLSGTRVPSRRLREAIIDMPSTGYLMSQSKDMPSKKNDALRHKLLPWTPERYSVSVQPRSENLTPPMSPQPFCPPPNLPLAELSAFARTSPTRRPVRRYPNEVHPRETYTCCNTTRNENIVIASICAVMVIVALISFLI